MSRHSLIGVTAGELRDLHSFLQYVDSDAIDVAEEKERNSQARSASTTTAPSFSTSPPSAPISIATAPKNIKNNAIASDQAMSAPARAISPANASFFKTLNMEDTLPESPYLNQASSKSFPGMGSDWLKEEVTKTPLRYSVPASPVNSSGKEEQADRRKSEQIHRNEQNPLKPTNAYNMPPTPLRPVSNYSSDGPVSAGASKPKIKIFNQPQNSNPQTPITPISPTSPSMSNVGAYSSQSPHGRFGHEGGISLSNAASGTKAAVGRLIDSFKSSNSADKSRKTRPSFSKPANSQQHSNSHGTDSSTTLWSPNASVTTVHKAATESHVDNYYSTSDTSMSNRNSQQSHNSDAVSNKSFRNSQNSQAESINRGRVSQDSHVYSQSLPTKSPLNAPPDAMMVPDHYYNHTQDYPMKPTTPKPEKTHFKRRSRSASRTGIPDKSNLEVQNEATAAKFEQMLSDSNQAQTVKISLTPGYLREENLIPRDIPAAKKKSKNPLAIFR